MNKPTTFCINSDTRDDDIKRRFPQQITQGSANRTSAAVAILVYSKRAQLGKNEVKLE